MDLLLLFTIFVVTNSATINSNEGIPIGVLLVTFAELIGYLGFSYSRLRRPKFSIVVPKTAVFFLFWINFATWANSSKNLGEGGALVLGCPEWGKGGCLPPRLPFPPLPTYA